MNKQIKKVLVVMVGIIAISMLSGCASTGGGSKVPEFGEPSDIQKILNGISDRFPLPIAGKQVTFSFEGDYWRGKVDGKDAFAGICFIVNTEDGALITLDQSFIYLDTGQINPLNGQPLARWQRTPPIKISLKYEQGPPQRISLVRGQDSTEE